jgi:hypothetical protein
MIYAKPKILAQSTVFMSECRPSSKPSGRPCDNRMPGGASHDTDYQRWLRKQRIEKEKKKKPDDNKN